MVNETIDYVKENIKGSELVLILVWSAIKALVTSILFFFAAVKIFELGDTAVSDIYRNSVLLYLGIFIPLFFISHLYYLIHEKVVRSAKEFFYTERTDWETYSFALIWQWTAIAGIACIILIGVPLIFEWIGEVLKIAFISALASGLLLYAYRDKLTSWKIIGKFIAFGIAIGCSTYALGVVIGFSIDLIGLIPTAIIMVMEFLFTGIYSYMELIAWVNESKREKIAREAREKKQREEKKPETTDNL